MTPAFSVAELAGGGIAGGAVEGETLARLDDLTVGGGHRKRHVVVGVERVDGNRAARAEQLGPLFQVFDRDGVFGHTAGNLNGAGAFFAQKIAQLLVELVFLHSQAEGTLRVGELFGRQGLKRKDFGVLSLDGDVVRDLFGRGADGALLQSGRDFKFDRIGPEGFYLLVALVPSPSRATA